MDEQTPPTEPQVRPPPEEPPAAQARALEGRPDDQPASRRHRAYLGVDATLVRIVTVGLAFLGGAGVLLYLAALLLMPEEGRRRLLDLRRRWRARAGGDRPRRDRPGGAAFAALAVIGAVIGWILFPIAFLVVAGLFAWWIASGERPAGTPGQILKRAALGLALLAVCLAVAVGGAWAAAAGSGASAPRS